MGPYLQNLRSQVGSQRILLPGVRAIILNDRGDVLLQRRTDMPLWSLPAGSLELDETALEALKREVLEETHLRVHKAEPMALYSGRGEDFEYPNGDKVQSFAIAFIVREWTGQGEADGVEGSEVRFWPLDSLPDDLADIHARTLDDFRRYQGVFMISDCNPDRKE